MVEAARKFRRRAAICFTVVAATASVLVPSTAGAQDATQLESRYAVALTETNGSGVTGTATLIVSSGTLRIIVDAAGTSAGREHPVALHRANDEASRCPRPADDRDDDGFVTADELTRVAGAPDVAVTQSGPTNASDLFRLDTAFRADGSGQLSVDRTLDAEDVPADEIGSLRLIVYGNDLNFSNRYEGAGPGRPAEVTIPVACGEVQLERIEIPEPFAGTSGTAGTVTRLYVSILQRSPEPAGHEFFVSDVDAGASAIDVVWAMASSPEFIQRFGPKLDDSTAEWVDFVYRSIFGRRADTIGRQYWISELDRGNLAREAMLFYFADSVEFKRTTATS